MVFCPSQRRTRTPNSLYRGAEWSLETRRYSKVFQPHTSNGKNQCSQAHHLQMQFPSDRWIFRLHLLHSDDHPRPDPMVSVRMLPDSRLTFSLRDLELQISLSRPVTHSRLKAPNLLLPRHLVHQSSEASRAQFVQSLRRDHPWTIVNHYLPNPTVPSARRLPGHEAQ